MAFDATGNLFVGINTLNNNGSIVKITPDGQVSNFVSGLLNPYEMAFDLSGNLYATGYPTNGGIGFIYKITPEGSVSNFGTGLTNPTGIVVVDGLLGVPEPASLGVLGVAAVGLMLRRWKL
jgi:hypothetical protein